MARIYVSSTYQDLEKHRELVYSSLRQLRHDVIAMEDYLAADERPVDKCLGDVARSDVYVGIFAFRYGYVPGKDNPEQKSITELEYREAERVGIPCLIFILDEQAPWPEAFRDGPTHGAERIKVRRDELRKERTVSFFHTAEELARLVSNAVQLCLEERVVTELISVRTRVWDPDRHPPSALLDANYRVVPFRSRTEEITDLTAWCARDNPVAIRLYTGAGGMGKTRLMLDFIKDLRQQGWKAGFLSGAAGNAAPTVLDALIFRPQRLLLVVDYAETRRKELHQILLRAGEVGPDRRVRIVLLARDVAAWWDGLKRLGDGVGPLLQGPVTNRLRLAPLDSDPADRAQSFMEAGQAFSAKLGRPVPAAAPDLTAPHFDRVLFVHMAALAAVEGRVIKEDRALLDFMLDRERRFWEALALTGLSSEAVAQAAAAATLLGGADDAATARRQLRRGAPLLRDQNEDVLGQLAEALHALYPGYRWLNGVQPDLLGEHLVECAGKGEL